MLYSCNNSIRRRRAVRLVSSVLWLLVILPSVGMGAGLVDYALSDVRVLYLFDNERTIDWPTLYYLNGEFACRIDLVTLERHTQFHASTTSQTEREFYVHHYYIPDDSTAMDLVTADLFSQRRPDLVILGPAGDNEAVRDFRQYLIDLPSSDSLLFNIIRILEHSDGETDKLGRSKNVVLNVREVARRYRERMDREIPRLVGSYYTDEIGVGILSHYRLVSSRLSSSEAKSDFLGGIKTNRLESIIDSLESEGPRKSTLLKQAGQFLHNFAAAGATDGADRVDLLVSGYRAVQDLIAAAEHSTADGLGAYLRRTLYRAERAALDAVGLSWEGRISLRDSPRGPIAKVVMAVSVDGPSDVVLAAIEIHPPGEAEPVLLDSVPRTITPHQSYVRQYLVDIDPTQFESNQPDSLTFTTVVHYARTPLRLSHSLPLREMPNLKVQFDPDYFVVPPVAQLDVDRIVASMAWNVVITKPPDLTGDVHIKLAAPRGVFAGAYHTDLSLDEGAIRRTVRIPFSVSNLLEQGIHFPTVSLVIDGQVVAADTGQMRIASCGIKESRTVAFLPDSTGWLEDCLGMTNAAIRPLTRRGLMTANLSAYKVILIGSGAAQTYRELPDARDRLEDYVRQGGSLVVFGQDYRWPRDVLPFMLVPSLELISGSDITVPIPEARILSKPHKILIDGLIRGFGHRREVAAAVVAPSEKVLTTPSGAVLLSVSRLGEGQFIYCGLPLFEMVSQLNLQAIHLLANILNY